MQILNKLIILLLLLFVTGCATTAPLAPRSRIVLPDTPKVVKLDNGKYDKSKYKGTDWVKPPKIQGQRGYWSFKDIETISKALTKWPAWAQDVEKIVGEHNGLTEDKSDTTKQWWHIWKK